MSNILIHEKLFINFDTLKKVTRSTQHLWFRFHYQSGEVEMYKCSNPEEFHYLNGRINNKLL